MLAASDSGLMYRFPLTFMWTGQDSNLPLRGEVAPPIYPMIYRPLSRLTAAVLLLDELEANLRVVISNTGALRGERAPLIDKVLADAVNRVVQLFPPAIFLLFDRAVLRQ
jgi:hypothetical protein